MLRFCLDKAGYPIAGMLDAVQTMTLEEFFELEDVAHFRRRQIEALSNLEIDRIAAKRAREQARG